MKAYPSETIIRLASYLKVLNRLEKDKQVVSSFELAQFLKINPNQVRKDLSYFGRFGRRGKGYSVGNLIENIKNILGINRNWCVGLCGWGNLGKALSSYKGFSQQGFMIKVIFEKDPKKLGKKISGIEVCGIEDLEKKVKKYSIEIVILAVPQEEAQNMAEKFYQAGIRAILNFAPTNLILPSDCLVRNVDMSSELSYLSYYLTHR